MKRLKSLALFAAVLSAAIVTGCNKDGLDNNVPSKPDIKIEKGDDDCFVKATVTSKIDLKSVIVTTSYGTGADQHEEIVDNITKFGNAKSYVYEKTFAIPAGYLEMTVTIKAENTKGYSATVNVTLKKDSSITMSNVIDAMDAAYAVWENTGTMPESTDINGFSFARPVYFEYAARTFINLYDGLTADPVINGGYGDCSTPDYNDTFVNNEISKNMLNDALRKMLNYASNNGIYPNYASYGSVALVPYDDPDGVKYEGYFTYRRAVVCVARMLSNYKAKGVLENISSDYKIIEPYVPSSAGVFTRAALVDGLSAAYADWSVNGTMPESITVSGTALSKVQYYYAAIKILLNAKNNDESDIDVLTYMMPENPARDSYDKDEISVFDGAVNGNNTEDLANAAARMLTYASTKNKGNGYFSNYVSYIRPNDTFVEFSLNRSLVCFARAIASFKANGTWPATVTSNHVAPSQTTIADFATQFVKVLEAWEANVGDIQVTGGDKFTNVHYVPSDFSIMVNGVSFNKANCYEAAVRSLKDMVENNTETSELLPTTHNYAWGANPYNEGTGNGGPFIQTEVDLPFMINYAITRQLPYAESKSTWSNFCTYPKAPMTMYNGVCCLERNLLMMARLYKYLLDNNITKDIGTALASVKFSATLY